MEREELHLKRPRTLKDQAAWAHRFNEEIAQLKCWHNEGYHDFILIGLRDQQNFPGGEMIYQMPEGWGTLADLANVLKAILEDLENEMM